MYTEDQRALFRFGDRAYDPVRVRRHLLLHSQHKFSEWVSTYNDSTSELEQNQAEEQLVGAARKAFNLPEITEQNGVGDGAVLDLLASYLEWLSAGPSVSTGTDPISRPCTDCHKPN